MKYLVILKRFEIWLLLAVVAFVISSAFRPEEAATPVAKEPEVVEKIDPIVHVKRAEETPDPDKDPVEEQKGLRVNQIEIQTAGSSASEKGAAGKGQVVALTLLARSRNGREVAVGESTLKAKTGKGAPVPYFFEPFLKEQTIGTEEDSIVTMKLWLEQPAESIWLEFQGETVEAVLPGAAPES